MIDYALILTRNFPDRGWSMDGYDYDGIVFEDDGPVPSQAELDALWPSVRDAEAWHRVRAERDALLTASDWTQMPDNALDAPTIAAWAVYRQALRDIPQTQADPDSVVWPAR